MSKQYILPIEVEATIQHQAMEIMKLKGERDELAAQLSEWVKANGPTGWIGTLRKCVEALNDENRWLAKSAMHYDWLKAHSWVSTDGVIEFGSGFVQTAPEHLDAAIDEAMK